MPLPVPNPTSEEIVAFSLITYIPTADVLAIVSADADQAISNEKWALVLDAIDAWPTVRDGASKLKRLGEIEFFEGTRESIRLDFRNNLRWLYGYPVLMSERQSAQSDVVVSSLEWF